MTCNLLAHTNMSMNGLHMHMFLLTLTLYLLLSSSSTSKCPGISLNRRHQYKTIKVMTNIACQYNASQPKSVADRLP
jgi:hypothetical protein